MGNYLDIDRNLISPCDGDLPEPRELTEEEMSRDYVRWDFPPMTAEDKRRLVRLEWQEAMDTVLYKW